jgi:glycine/D-amino acid oxidase-like deaminating enzyme
MGDTGSAVVVGAGAFGVAAADALARRGWSVTIVERFAPANARGSSGDRTRLLRLAHGEGSDAEDEWLMRSAARGIAGWDALADEEELDLTVRVGLVLLAREHGGGEERALDRLRRAGIEHERLAPAEIRSLFPDIAVDDLAFGAYEPGARVIRATDAVEGLLRRARRNGARVMRGSARPAGPGRLTVDGAPLVADAVVWACGAWLGDLLPDDAPVRPAWQDVVHWQTPVEWIRGPAWFDGELYGFPDVDGLGMKVVSHVPGPSFDLERDARVPNAQAIADLSRAIPQRFPALRGAVPLWSRVMPYEMTPDGQFVVGPSARHERHWVMGGGSGHGFKHAPALGEHVADLVEGRAEVEPLLAPGPRLPRTAQVSALG